MTTNIFTATAAKFKGITAKLLTAGLLAGAVALAVPAKANAQEVVVFARNPHPVFVRYDRFRHEEFRRDRFDRRFDHRFDRRYYR